MLDEFLSYDCSFLEESFILTLARLEQPDFSLEFIGVDGLVENILVGWHLADDDLDMVGKGDNVEKVLELQKNYL